MVPAGTVMICKSLRTPTMSQRAFWMRLFRSRLGFFTLARAPGKAALGSTQPHSRPRRRPPIADLCRLALEPLENRLSPAVTASIVGTTLQVNFDAANDTATITGVALSSVIVSGTGLAATPFSGFNDIQAADTANAPGQSVHFNGAGGVPDVGNFGGNGLTVTNVE